MFNVFPNKYTALGFKSVLHVSRSKFCLRHNEKARYMHIYLSADVKVNHECNHAQLVI